MSPVIRAAMRLMKLQPVALPHMIGGRPAWTSAAAKGAAGKRAG